MDFIKENNLSFINWSLADKDESSALLKPNNKIITDEALSESGNWIKNIIKNTNN